MNTTLWIRRSIMAWLKGLFQAPPAGTGLVGAYTVYGETELRAVEAGTLTPARPCVFLVDSYMRPTESQKSMPLVIVEQGKDCRDMYEIGNEDGRVTPMMVHVFGRQRGERDLLSSFIQNNTKRVIPIYDYTTGSLPVFVENAQVVPGVENENIAIWRSDLRIESSLDAWAVVSFHIRLLT